MEGKNTTTVGGVTFGGGDPAPQPSPAPEKISNPSLGNQPVMAQSALGVDVVAPTHFDPAGPSGPQKVTYEQINTPNMDPNLPKPKPVKADDPAKKTKRLTALAATFGVLAVVFLFLAVAGLVFGLTKTDELSAANQQISDQAAVIKAVEESTGKTGITKPEDVPVYKATTGYIYISEWNIKLKIPADLDKVSYYIDQNYREHICFNAVQKGIQYFPDFANIAKNTGRQGCLYRIKTTEGEFDAATGVSFGTKVFTYKDYSFFYTAPVDYSKDTAELGLEHTADQIIKNMLTDNIETYE